MRAEVKRYHGTPTARWLPYWAILAMRKAAAGLDLCGVREIALPRLVETAYDLYHRQKVARNTDRFDLILPAASSSLWYIGKQHCWLSWRFPTHRNAPCFLYKIAINYENKYNHLNGCLRRK